MVDYYRRYFEGLEFDSCNCGRLLNVNDVKLYGSRLLWGEVWLIYFGMVV